jgi:hypothetical protein
MAKTTKQKVKDYVVRVSRSCAGADPGKNGTEGILAKMSAKILKKGSLS